MHVRCPHCHNPIEILDDASLSEIACPSCDSHFSLVGEETVSYRGDERKTMVVSLRKGVRLLPRERFMKHSLGGRSQLARPNPAE